MAWAPYPLRTPHCCSPVDQPCLDNMAPDHWNLSKLLFELKRGGPRKGRAIGNGRCIGDSGGCGCLKDIGGAGNVAC